MEAVPMGFNQHVHFCGRWYIFLHCPNTTGVWLHCIKDVCSQELDYVWIIAGSQKSNLLIKTLLVTLGRVVDDFHSDLANAIQDSKIHLQGASKLLFVDMKYSGQSLPLQVVLLVL